MSRWLADRAAAAPVNFLHLLRLVEAERAWAVGDFHAAVLAFDAARHEAAQRRRPWHRALIAEHAARFCLAHGVDHAGHDLLPKRARSTSPGARPRRSTSWTGPTRPCGHDPTRPAAEPAGDSPARSTVTTGTVDLLGILSASQALSSETSIERLHARVVQVLGAMTGATDVHLLLWGDDRQDWLLPAPGTAAPARSAAPATNTRCRCPCCDTSSGRASRWSWATPPATTGSPAILTSPTSAAARCWPCPILSRGALQAVLLLENRLIRGAFSTERLDAVKLIAGQLAVSLDNAHLYAEFRRIADEQAALRRVATLVARGGAAGHVFAAVADEVGALFDADGTAIVRFEPDGDATVMGRSAPGTRARHTGRTRPLGGRTWPRRVQTGRAGRATDDYSAAPARPPNSPRVGHPLRGRRADRGRGPAVGRHRRRLPAARSVAGEDTEATPGRLHRAGRHRHRQRREPGRAHGLAGADRRHRRPDPPPHRTGPARRRPAAAGLAGAATARGAGGGATRARRARRQLDRAVAEANRRRWTNCARSPAASTRRSSTEGGLGPALSTLARRSPIPVELDIRDRADGCPSRSRSAPTTSSPRR